MTYNITFTLGDPGGDGHANTVDFHMESNYSPAEIGKAYREATEKIGWDYVENFGVDFDCRYTMDPENVQALLAAGVYLDPEYITTKEDASKWYPEGSYTLDGLEDYIDIFVNIVRLILPNFYLRNRDLQEQWLYLLNGAAYGLAYHGE